MIILSIPEFIDKYHLPPGEHVATLEEIENRFACSSEMRKRVWYSFTALLKRFELLGIYPETLLVDGSFTTGRDEPEDVDFAALFSVDKVKNALANASANQHDMNAILMFVNDSYQSLVRDLWGTHALVAFDDATLSGWSLLFRKGLNGAGLRHPDAIRDPSWVVTPIEKGILKVEFNKTA